MLQYSGTGLCSVQHISYLTIATYKTIVMQQHCLYFQAFFCGYDNICSWFNGYSAVALARAKRNIEKWFPVVGVLEELHDSLRVMERVVPGLYKGALEIQKKKEAAKRGKSRNKKNI